MNVFSLMNIAIMLYYMPLLIPIDGISTTYYQKFFFVK